jgi:hypothetical protein
MTGWHGFTSGYGPMAADIEDSNNSDGTQNNKFFRA